MARALEDPVDHRGTASLESNNDMGRRQIGIERQPPTDRRMVFACDDGERLLE